jgi:hypothetical protein
MDHHGNLVCAQRPNTRLTIPPRPPKKRHRCEVANAGDKPQFREASSTETFAGASTGMRE